MPLTELRRSRVGIRPTQCWILYVPTNAERFETTWVIPKLSAIIPVLRTIERSFPRYSELFASQEGEFLNVLRGVYEMKPSNATLLEVVRAWEDLMLPDRPFYNVDEGRKLLVADISNFETLLEEFTKKYNSKAFMRSALFDNPLKSTSEKRNR
jgi:hypothetical protein